MPSEPAEELIVQLPPSLGRVKSAARAEVVEPRLRRALDVPVRVVVAASYSEISETLERRAVAMVWAPAAIFERYRGSCRYALRSSRIFGDSQRSAIVARADSGLTISTLRGKRAAWVDPQSMSGYLMAKRWLAKQGVDVDAVLAEQVFTSSFADSVQSVLSREADITAIFVHGKSMTDFRRSLEEIRGGARDDIEPIAYTDRLPADGILISSDLEPELAKQLHWLLRAPGDPTCLRSVCNVEDFVEVSGPSSLFPQ